jgi:hypothetical protein
MRRVLIRLQRLLRRPIKVSVGHEPYGPFLPWQEVLARSTALVPGKRD